LADSAVLFFGQAAYDKVRKAKKQAAERTQRLDENRKKVKLGR
jgi:DnaJ family protein C protein 17